MATRAFATAGEAEAFSAQVAGAVGMPWTGTPVGNGRHAPTEQALTRRLVAPVGSTVTIDDSVADLPRVKGAKMGEVQPQWFGAVGDGKNDDTSAIQKAIDTAGDVLFPPGTYLLTAPLVLRKNTRLHGECEYTTVLSQSAQTDCMTIVAAGQNTRFVVERLGLNGGTNGIHTTLGSNWYIDRNSSFRDLRITSQSNAGILNEAGMIGCAHRNLHMEMPGGYGIYSDGDDLLGSTTWDNVRVAGATEAAIFIRQTSTGGLQLNITMTGLIAEYNRKVGLMLNSCRVTLINPHFEGNGIDADAAFPFGTPDVSLDSNWPDAVGTATGVCHLVGGVFSQPGGNQYARTAGTPYDTTACRVWAKNYGTILMEDGGTFHRNDDRLDCVGHADKLVARLCNTQGSVTVIANAARWP